MKPSLALILLAAGFSASAQPTSSAKDIYLDRAGSRPAVKFSVLLDRAGKQRAVPTTYAFRDHDKLRFNLQVSRDSYVYVLNRTVAGDPFTVDRYAGSRGIEVIRDENRLSKKPGVYQLLFPNRAAGQNNLVKAFHPASIPGTRESFFRMDQHPGMEKLLVVVSARPIDIGRYFNIRTGQMKPHNDTAGDLLGRLTRDLMTYSSNSDVQESKGIDIVDGFAAAKNGSKPMLVAVDLRHLPAAR